MDIDKEEIIGIFLAIMIVLILIGVIRLFLFKPNEGKIYAENYIENLEQGLKEIEKQGEYTFFTWRQTQDYDHYLVYFGEKSRANLYTTNNIQPYADFFLKKTKNGKNALCICYFPKNQQESDTSFICNDNYCTYLNQKIINSDNSESQFSLEILTGTTINFLKTELEYKFNILNNGLDSTQTNIFRTTTENSEENLIFQYIDNEWYLVLPTVSKRYKVENLKKENQPPEQEYISYKEKFDDQDINRILLDFHFKAEQSIIIEKMQKSNTIEIAKNNLEEGLEIIKNYNDNSIQGLNRIIQENIRYVPEDILTLKYDSNKWVLLSKNWDTKYPLNELLFNFIEPNGIIFSEISTPYGKRYSPLITITQNQETNEKIITLLNEIKDLNKDEGITKIKESSIENEFLILIQEK